MGAAHASNTVEIVSGSAGLPLTLAFVDDPQANASKPRYVTLTGKSGKPIVLKKPPRCRASNDEIKEHWGAYLKNGDYTDLVRDFTPPFYTSDVKSAVKLSAKRTVVYTPPGATPSDDHVLWLESRPRQQGALGLLVPCLAKDAEGQPLVAALQGVYWSAMDDLIAGLEIVDGVLGYIETLVRMTITALKAA